MNVEILKDVVCLVTGENLLKGEILRNVVDTGSTYKGYWYGTLCEIPVDSAGILMDYDE